MKSSKFNYPFINVCLGDCQTTGHVVRDDDCGLIDLSLKLMWMFTQLEYVQILRSKSLKKV